MFSLKMFLLRKWLQDSSTLDDWSPTANPCQVITCSSVGEFPQWEPQGGRKPRRNTVAFVIVINTILWNRTSVAQYYSPNRVWGVEFVVPTKKFCTQYTWLGTVRISFTSNTFLLLSLFPSSVTQCIPPFLLATVIIVIQLIMTFCDFILDLFLQMGIDFQTHHRLREFQGRNMAEYLNERVQWWSIGQSVLVVIVGISQVFILRHFFTDKRSSIWATLVWF